MKSVIICRGLPGSGKSTRAFNRAYHIGTTGGTSCIVSADKFFEVNGRYQFDPKKLPQAHESCFNSYIDAILDGVDAIIVDNTNTQLWEFIKYVKIAIIAGYEVELDQVTPKDDAEIIAWFKRCIHGVPLDKMKQMHARWQTITNEDLEEIVRRRGKNVHVSDH